VQGWSVVAGLPASGGAEGDQGFSSDRSRESFSDLRILKGAATWQMKTDSALVSCPAREFPLESNAMRKILGPFALVVGAILLLVAAAYWYEQKYGSTGPFPPQGRGH
jgi:hypothetical protein